MRARKTNPEIPKLAFTKAESAAALNIGVCTLNSEIRAGAIRAVHIRGRVVIAAAELHRYLDERSGTTWQVS